MILVWLCFQGSNHCCSSSKQWLTTVPHPTGEREDFLNLPDPWLHWPVYLALCYLSCVPPHPHSTGIFMASHKCLVERIFWLFLQWLPPYLDDFPSVNINFVMSMTPTGLQVWWNHRECLAPRIPYLLETTLLVKARHGQGSLESLAEPLTPTGFFPKCFICKEVTAWHSVPVLFTKCETQTKL